MSKKFHCPYCHKVYLEKQALYSHMEKYHNEYITEDFPPSRLYFNYVNKKDVGHCVVCGKPTTWNEVTEKYNRLCSEKCKKFYVQEFQQRMIKVHGKTTQQMLSDPEMQKRMLSNRKISGKYKWSDGSTEIEYVGSYELDFLKFLDLFLHFDSKDIISPAPQVFYYNDNGNRRFYIPDFYIVSINTLVEVKDGEDNKAKYNNRLERDARKEALKDEIMNNQKDYNFVKVTNKNNSQFLNYLMKLKNNTGEVEEKKEKFVPLIDINEAVNLAKDDIITKIKLSEETYNLHPEWITAYQNKMKRLASETGEERISRIAVHPIDGSSYQKIKKSEYKGYVNPKPETFVNENTYLVSDFHFGKYGKDYDLKNLNKINKLPRNANLLILGDISYVKAPCKDYLIDLFSKIRDDINMYLILGNHDCYYLDFYYKLGFKGVYERIIMPNKNWVFSHQPCDGIIDSNMINFHGHIHEETTYTTFAQNSLDNKINVWEGYCKNGLKTLSTWYKENQEHPLQKTYMIDNEEVQLYSEDVELIGEGFLNQLTFGFRIHPHQNAEETLKKHSYQGYLSFISKVKKKEDLEYLRKDVNIGINLFNTIGERIDKCNRLGKCIETKSYYDGIKKKYINKGITKRDCDLTVQWFKEVCRPALNEKLKSLNEDAILIDETLETRLTRPFLGKEITLYHGTDKKFNVIMPVSINAGTKLSHPRYSSFWRDNKDNVIGYAIGVKSWKAFKDAYGIELKSLIKMNKDKDVCITKDTKDKLDKAMKNSNEVAYVYQVTVPTEIVGRGHLLTNAEYTIDQPVKPDKIYTIKLSSSEAKKFNDNHYTVLSQEEYDNMVDYKDKIFSSNQDYSIMDFIVYRDMKDVKKIKSDIRKLEKINLSESYYRISYNNDGIYNAYKDNSSKDEWIKFLSSDECKWLKHPPIKYEKGYNSYFTEKGYKKFNQEVLPIFSKNLDASKIKVEKIDNVDKKSIKYRDEDQIVIDINTLSESYIFDRDNLELNLDKWSEGTPLWITGTSGDGKSTLAEKYAKMYNNTLIVHTDAFLVRLCRTKEWNDTHTPFPDDIISHDYINKNKNIPYGTDEKGWKNDNKYFIDYFNYIIKEAPRKYSKYKIIVEGCDITHYDAKYISQQPLIIIGISRLTASTRRIKRDMEEEHTLVDSIFREIKRRPMYINELDDEKERFWKEVDSYSESADFNNTLYFVSFKNLNNTNLIPRIPSNFLTENGYEDNHTPRVCASTSIKGCLSGLSQGLNKKEAYVHVLNNVSDKDIYHPTIKEVPDCKITNEVWIKKPVKISCIGKILILDDMSNDGIEYKYGNNKTAKLYTFNYKWIEKYDIIQEDSILTESEHASTLDKNFKKKNIKEINYEILDIHDPKAEKYIKNDSYLGKFNKNHLKKYVGEIIADKDKEVVIGRFLIGTGRDEGYICALRVYEIYRGYGFGDILIKDAINKYGGYDLNVYKDNKVAIDLYKKNGFVILDKFNSKNDHYMKLKSKLSDDEKDLIINESVINESKSNITFSNSFSDVKNIIDTLNDEELHHICSGIFKNSPYVVYRKVLKYNNVPVAFIDVYSIPEEMDKDEAVVVVACKDEYRGNGYTDILIKDALKYLKIQNKIKKLYWETTKSNKASSTLAKRNGFAKSKDINKDDDNYFINLESKINFDRPFANNEDEEAKEIYSKDANLLKDSLDKKNDI